MTTAERVRAADDYLAARTGCYEYRCQRYRAARNAMCSRGLDDDSTVIDVGAGWTELDAYLRTAADWRGRYIPVDACVDGVELENWIPPRRADFFVALEVIEHVALPMVLVARMQRHADRGVIISTPNPRTTDVFAMDPTHKTPIDAADLRAFGFKVEAASFYGREADSLFAVWEPKRDCERCGAPAGFPAAGPCSEHPQ